MRDLIPLSSMDWILSSTHFPKTKSNSKNPRCFARYSNLHHQSIHNVYHNLNSFVNNYNFSRIKRSKSKLAGLTCSSYAFYSPHQKDQSHSNKIENSQEPTAISWTHFQKKKRRYKYNQIDKITKRKKNSAGITPEELLRYSASGNSWWSIRTVMAGCSFQSNEPIESWGRSSKHRHLITTHLVLIQIQQGNYRIFYELHLNLMDPRISILGGTNTLTLPKCQRKYEMGMKSANYIDNTPLTCWNNNITNKINW